MKRLYFIVAAILLSFTSFATVGPILGTPVICDGSTTTLSDATTGGTWTSSNVTIAIVGSSTGIVTGLASGVTIISYTSGGTTVTQAVTVNPLPAAISGTPSVCVGLTTGLTDAIAGGTWSNSCPLLATIDSATGTIFGVAAGTCTFTYTLSTGCYRDIAVTVNPAPSTITGTLGICVGSSTTLSNSTPGGIWSSSNYAVANMGTFSSVVIGTSPGTATITYSLPTSCFTTVVVTVNPLPSSISAPSSICVGSYDTLTTTGGGIWSSGTPSIITVISGDILHGITAGTGTLTYAFPTGCMTTTVISVNTTPAPITGPDAVCASSTITLSDATISGTWSSSVVSVITISGTGVVTPVTIGTSTISYTVAGCGSATTVVTVITSPPAILGSTNVCVGSRTNLSDAMTGGTWSSSNASIADMTGTSGGSVTGIAPGTATISYTIVAGCTSTVVVTVNTGPSLISGSTSLYVGNYDTLTVSPTGGTWGGGGSIVTITPVATGAVLYGVATGTVVITYISPGGCGTTFSITVSPSTTSILGPTSVCLGSTITLNDATTGGTWSSSNTTVATIGSVTGVVTTVALGTTTITYTLPTSGYATTTVTVVSAPAAISGSADVCVGLTTILSDATAGGTWSSSNAAVASLSGTSSGMVIGISPGMATISYTIGAGCSSTIVVTVNADLSPISGLSSICVGSYDTVTISPSGGTWGGGGVVTITPTSTGAVLYGVSAGVGIITYRAPTGCATSFTVTVNALPGITATATKNCGGTYSITGSGGGGYVWAPATGLSCTACTTTTAIILTSATYTVSGTDAAGCTNTNIVTLNGNRISGFITMTTTPTDTLKVWLIQFNPTDSTLTAEDSTLSCMDSGTPYYEFDSEPAGNYLVKGKLLSSIPGTSGYVPTYGLSSMHWDTATTVIHASATDTQHINMIYGIVPPGPGFIGGLISAGAGRGTSGVVPAVGMLVYLEDASGSILTYTYTNSTGNYSFSGLAYGTYIVYPVDYHYHTTPWVSVTISASSDSSTLVNFYQHLTYGTITPTGTTLLNGHITTATQLSIYPNPAINELNISWTNEQTGDATISITDIAGYEVYKSLLNINSENGNSQVDVHCLDNGIYFISIRSGTICYTNKLLIQR